MKTKPDDWYDKFRRLSKKDQYQMMLKTLREEKIETEDEVETVVDCLFSVLEALDYGNLIDEHLDLIKLIKEQHPQVYKRNYMFIDSFLVDYHIFTKQDKLAEKSLKNFIRNPIESIDKLISVLGKLRLYQKADLAIKIVEKVFSKVIKSKSLLDDTDYYFSRVMHMKLLQNEYENFLANKDNDWKSFTKMLKKYNYISDEYLNKKVDFMKITLFDDDLKGIVLTGKNQGKSLTKIAFGFLRYMHAKQKMSFICSGYIWDEFLDFLSNIEGKKMMSFEQLFSFSQNNLNKYLGQLFGGMISNKQADAIALLWSIPYLYDFLLSEEVISKSLYGNIIKIVKNLKPDMQKAANTNLWMYAFWTNWDKLNYHSQEEFNAEKDVFQKSIDIKTSLSEEIPEIEEDNFGFDLDEDNMEDFVDDFDDDEKLVEVQGSEKKITEPYQSNKVGRNEPCPCRNGKKYKRCCGR